MASRASVPAVEMKKAVKNYGKVQALKGIDMTVEQGEVVAFLGPNGAGKSTAISLMLGLRAPTSGSVSLLGESPRQASNRRHIGAMLQESGVPGTLTVYELIELFGHFHDHAMKTREVLKMVQLENKARVRLSALSGGQQQRIYFALALVGDPDILFLDEPTTGLDVEARRNFWDQINAQVARGKTIVLTTHNLEEADALAQRIVVINKGEIIADGSPSLIKSYVGGKHVRFHASDLALADLRAISTVQDVRQLDTFFDVYTYYPEVVLATLFRCDIAISDLEVTGAGLEEAFLSLTHASNGHE
jgi:ABC-2 type transport system ATP-binding protein